MLTPIHMFTYVHGVRYIYMYIYTCICAYFKHRQCVAPKPASKLMSPSSVLHVRPCPRALLRDGATRQQFCSGLLDLETPMYFFWKGPVFLYYRLYGPHK